MSDESEIERLRRELVECQRVVRDTEKVIADRGVCEVDCSAPLPERVDRLIVSERSAEYWEAMLIQQSLEVEQALGVALHYPRFADDPENFPDAPPDDPAVCVGEHTAVTLADEAAGRIKALEAEVADLRERLRTQDTRRMRHWHDKARAAHRKCERVKREALTVGSRDWHFEQFAAFGSRLREYHAVLKRLSDGVARLLCRADEPARAELHAANEQAKLALSGAFELAPGPARVH